MKLSKLRALRPSYRLSLRCATCGEKFAAPRTEEIFRRFGGPRRLQTALKLVGFERDLSCIYRWRLSKEAGGTGGVIPTSAWGAVMDAAKLRKIDL